ncbi:MAG: Gfo/Idh/MocA family oxidoreductase [Anaerolineae bacterium]
MVTLGQVGLGYWGPNLLRNFNGLAQARVKVCCDLDQTALQRAGSQYPGMVVTTDYADLLDDPEVEGVIVTAPTPAHYELAKAALLTGRHVFVEKPIALAVAEAEELADAGRGAGPGADGRPPADVPPGRDAAQADGGRRRAGRDLLSLRQSAEPGPSAAQRERHVEPGAARHLGGALSVGRRA